MKKLYFNVFVVMLLTVNLFGQTKVTEPSRIRDWVGRTFSYEAYPDSINFGAGGDTVITTNTFTMGPWNSVYLLLYSAGAVQVDSVILMQCPFNTDVDSMWIKVSKLTFTNHYSVESNFYIHSIGAYGASFNVTGAYPFEFFRLKFYSGAATADGLRIRVIPAGWNQFWK